GQIITIIDLGKKVGISPTELNDTSRNIIVDSRGEHIGFLVERIGDVVQADWDDVAPPPANMSGVQGKFFKGVLKTEGTLIGILDVEEVLK
ncbi:MAG: chemotaxis protein CheW, partial [Deltaproteobacteria bacterium]|nr:chemotaxis protein CheW [Deltaproteobacteria bacterium]